MKDEKIKDVVKVESVAPKEVAPTPAKEEKPKGLDSKNTILVLIYLLYKTNQISNVGIKSMLSIIDKPFPDDLATYLVQEAAKV